MKIYWNENIDDYVFQSSDFLFGEHFQYELKFLGRSLCWVSLYGEEENFSQFITEVL